MSGKEERARGLNTHIVDHADCGFGDVDCSDAGIVGHSESGFCPGSQLDILLRGLGVFDKHVCAAIDEFLGD
jgi:hypothetical protein